MVFIPTIRRRRRRDPRVQTFAVIVALMVAGVSVYSSYVRNDRPRGGHAGSRAELLMVTAIIIPVVILLVVTLIRGRNEDPPGSYDTTGAEDSAAREDFEQEGRPFAMILALVAALLAIAVGMFAYTRTAHAQGTQDRGAFVLTAAKDTVVMDRFTRTADSLTGSVALKGQARVDYSLALGPDNTVRWMHIRQFKWGAGAADAPSSELSIGMQGDSAIFQVGANTTRLATKAGAIPSFNNAFAILELFTRRARSAGGSGEFQYLAINGGITLPITVRPLGPDSALLTIAGQQEHFRVDAAGRILGGTVGGQQITISRASETEAAKSAWGTSVKPAEKPDYSAPRGAPYTAEEVSFKGPGGITLGGTLTKPVNARGPLPAVVTITGSGQQDRDEAVPIAGGVRLFRQVADTLSRVGIAVLRLDDRGIGASTGDFAASTTADFADDIRAALAWLRARSDIDPNRLALIGHSEGGMIAPMVAATDPRLRAITIMAGPADRMSDIIMGQNKWVADHNPKLTPAQRDSVLADARVMLAPERQIAPAVKFWMSYDPAPAARKVKAATLILQGETDRQVPVANAEKLASLIRAGGNRDVTVKTLPATDHLFLADSTGDFLDMYKHVKTNKVSPVILGALADWLALRLGAKTVPGSQP